MLNSSSVRVRDAVSKLSGASGVNLTDNPTVFCPIVMTERNNIVTQSNPTLFNLVLYNLHSIDFLSLIFEVS